MKSERDQEVIDNLPLVTFILKKYFRNFDEDMFQIGCLGLIKAVDTYNVNKKVTKGTYYGNCIYNEISYNLRFSKSKKRGAGMQECSLYDTVHENITFEDIIEDTRVNIEEDSMNNDLIETLYSSLEDDEKYIIRHYFGLFGAECKTQYQIAKEFNVTQPTISRELKGILEKMKNEGGEFPYL